MRWVFYIIGIVSLAFAGLFAANSVSDIQLILAAVFALGGLVAFGFGGLYKRRKE